METSASQQDGGGMVIELTADQQLSIARETGLHIERLRGDRVRFAAMALAARAVSAGGHLTTRLPPVVVALTSEQQDLLQERSGVAATELLLADDIIDAQTGATGWGEDWSGITVERALSPSLQVSIVASVPAQRPERTVLLLEPPHGADQLFGDGGHPTTRMCAELLERYAGSAERVIDVGTGSGVLAIAAAMLGSSDVLALDTQPQAVQAASRNVTANEVQDRVTVAGRPLIESDRAADVVIANLLPHLLVGLAPLLSQAVRPDGVVIVSGIVAPRAAAVTAALTEHGFVPELSLEERGWTAHALRRG